MLPCLIKVYLSLSMRLALHTHLTTELDPQNCIRSFHLIFTKSTLALKLLSSCLNLSDSGWQTCTTRPSYSGLRLALRSFSEELECGRGELGEGLHLGSERGSMSCSQHHGQSWWVPFFQPVYSTRKTGPSFIHGAGLQSFQGLGGYGAQ